MLIDRNDAANFCDDLRRQNKKIVFTNGQRDEASNVYDLQAIDKLSAHLKRSKSNVD